MTTLAERNQIETGIVDNPAEILLRGEPEVGTFKHLIEVFGNSSVPLSQVNLDSPTLLETGVAAVLTFSIAAQPVRKRFDYIPGRGMTRRDFLRAAGVLTASTVAANSILDKGVWRFSDYGETEEADQQRVEVTRGANVPRKTKDDELLGFANSQPFRETLARLRTKLTEVGYGFDLQKLMIDFDSASDRFFAAFSASNTRNGKDSLFVISPVNSGDTFQLDGQGYNFQLDKETGRINTVYMPIVASSGESYYPPPKLLLPQPQYE